MNKYQEALKKLKEMELKFHLDKYGMASSGNSDILQELVDKTTLIKLTTRVNEHNHIEYVCKCGKAIDKNDNYCYNCGQKLDWRD